MNCFSNNKELNDEKQIKLDCRLGKGGFTHGGFNIKMCTECKNMHKTDMVFAIYLGTGIQAELVDSQLISTSGTKIIIVSGTNRSNGHVQLYFYCTLKLDMISREEIVLQSAH